MGEDRINNTNEMHDTPSMQEPHPISPVDNILLSKEMEPNQIIGSTFSDSPTASQEPAIRERFLSGVLGLHIPWRDILTVTILLVILLAGYWLRSIGRNWDDFTHLHPDERFLTDIATKIRSGRPLNPARLPPGSPNVEPAQQIAYCNQKYPGPSAEAQAEMSEDELAIAIRKAGKGGYFDAFCSDLNPSKVDPTIWVYGEFPLFTVRVLGETYNQLTADEFVATGPPWTGYNGAHLVGRAMNAVFDTLSILLVFLITSRLFGRWPALLAAGFYAFAVFPIQQSHFWTVDAFTSFWVVLAIYFAVRIMDQASLVPERFSPLPWLVGALAIWLAEIDANGGQYVPSIVIYLSIFLAVGVITTLAAEQKRELVAALVLLLTASLLISYAHLTSSTTFLEAFGLTLAEIKMPVSPAAAYATFAVLVILVTFWLTGWSRYAAFAGTFPWLSSAFGLWVFDFLAHYDKPGLGPLLVYLLMFTGVALAVSGVRYARLHPVQANLITIALLPALVFFVAIVFGLGVISWWGLLSMPVLVALLGGAAAFGLQDELSFGLAFGAALAGRINVLPLFGVLLVALIIRSLPLFDWRMFRYERNYHWLRLVIGVVAAGFGAFLAFRILNPHAFDGPSILGLKLNEGWKADVVQAQHLVSGNADIPPNWQWTSRVKWLFPWQNIVLYGLGVPLGLAAWAGFGWGLVSIAMARRQWTRLAIPAAWVLVYFGWLGRNWVTTMRYFMPIYAMLCLFAGWGLADLIRYVYQVWKTAPRVALRRWVVVPASLILIVVVGHTLAYGYGSTKIATTQLTRVAASRYAQEYIPGDIGLYIDEPSGNTRMVNLGIWSSSFNPEIIRLEDGNTTRIELKDLPGTVTAQALTLHLVGDPMHDVEVERLRVAIYVDDPVDGELLIGGQLLEDDFSREENYYGSEYTVVFAPSIPLASIPGRKYYLELEALDGGPMAISRRLNVNATVDAHATLFFQEIEPRDFSFPVPDGNKSLTYLSADSVNTYDFVARASGDIRYLTIPHLSEPFGDPNEERVQVVLADTRRALATGFVATAEMTGDFNPRNNGHLLFGPTLTLELDQSFPVIAGDTYSVSIIPSKMLALGGSAVAWEGPWDDPMPATVCGVPLEMHYRDDLPSGLCSFTTFGIDLYSTYYIGLTMNMFWPDEPAKRDDIMRVLNQTDYIVIGSNRFYDSFNRIPTRWPMSTRYYEALFSGELGFELERTFTSYARFGPIEWVDQVLPTSGLFNWRNDFEAEEAYHVYTHPATFIFRKTSDYSPEKAEAILNVNVRTVDQAIGNLYEADTLPVNRLTWQAPAASQSPTALQFTAEQHTIQHDGGTWSDLFDRDAFYNRNQVAGVVVWWALIILVGWITLPLLDFIFPALPDRGFAVGKLVGWVLVAWVAWFGSSLQVQLWSQTGLVALLVLLVVVNAIITYYRRAQLLAFVKTRWRHLVFSELLATLLFVFFVGVRLGNPDLWHNNFGGEKPMNFAYFNGVLRSTIFPPIDPWFSNGYINYYYWGYVLVGAPTKVLGIVPSFAYNLILPTLFSMTGMGAFAVAFNLVAWTRERRLENSRADEQVDEQSAAENKPADRREHPGPVANPYVAGIAALMLAVILGNLDTVRVLATAIAAAGDWPGKAALEQPLINQALTEFRTENGREPDADELQKIYHDAGLSRLEETQEWFSAFWRGFIRVTKGERPLSVPANRWYWMPTRVIGELSDRRGHNAINEMPYFTFLYGDLHAHMMAMPLTLLVILFLTAEILGAGRKLRSPLAMILALFVGGLTVGLLRPTNTWDWPTYMMLGAFGLTFAAWLGQGRLRGHLPSVPLYNRLCRFLDLRYILQLWPLLLVVPVGMMVRGGLHFHLVQDYENRLEHGEIPAICAQLKPDSIELALYPQCEGNFEPKLGVMDLMLWGMAALGAVIGLYACGLIFLGNRFDRNGLLAWIATLGIFGFFSFVTIWPYNANFATAYGKILSWDLDKTPLWAFLDIHGVFLFIVASMLLWQTSRWLRHHYVRDLRGLGVPLLAVIGLVPFTLIASLYFGLGEYRIFLVTLPLLVWLMILFLLPDQSPVERWVYVLTGLAVTLAMAVEVVVLQGDIGRQNTVFKFYIQVWLLLSIAGGVSLAWLIRAVERWRPLIGGTWQMALAVLLSIALLYPLTATQGRFQDRFSRNNNLDQPLTLDGMEYMKYATRGEDPDGIGPIPGVWYNLAGDYYLIRWLQDNVQGTPNIIEGQFVEYSWSSRVANNTGLPTVLGWRHHQSQQRNLAGLDRMLTSRLNNVRAFYSNPDIGVAWNLIDFYGIEYIVVGSFERIIYEDVKEPDTEHPTFRQGLSAGLAKFDSMVEMGLLEVVYQREVCIHPDIFTVENCPPERISTDVVYHVIPNAQYQPVSAAAQLPSATGR